MTETLNLLRIDSSARTEGSTTRAVLDRLTEVLSEQTPVSVTLRETESLPHVNGDWIGANFTPDEERSDAQKATLALSDSLIDELEAADVLLIGVPIYNFGVPASLKAWVDLVARARKTFQYTENGPEGLLRGKRAILVVASGGTQMDSAIDFATPYMRQALSFIGIEDVSVVAADQQMINADSADRALEDAAQLAARFAPAIAAE